MRNHTATAPDVEDAFNFAVRYLREGRRGPYADYGYELYVPNVMRQYVQDILGVREPDPVQILRDISPPFYAAAWELCRRGILRPGVRRYGEQVTEDGSGGNGYSVTPSGREWLQRAGQYDYVPIEPGRFARMLEGFAAQFGEGFRERAQEAVRGYGANGYLACCAMCGAAAESIFLALAIAKTTDEDRVLRMYESAGGRGRVENLIIGQAPTALQSEFRGLSNLLKYWRDAAAHGRRSPSRAAPPLALGLDYCRGLRFFQTQRPRTSRAEL